MGIGPAVDDLDAIHTVVQLNGHLMEVLTAEEAAFYTEQQRRYTSENTFTAISDETDRCGRPRPAR